MKVYTCAQRSPEWYQLRAGRLTGSVASALLAKGRGKEEAAPRRTLRASLIAEQMTGIPQDDVFGEDKPAYIQRGIDKEGDGIGAYETQTGAMVLPVGFIAHDELMAGYSPDGLVGHDGIVEIKCPKSATHLGYHDDPSTLLNAYRAQVIHGLWVTQRSWCDLVSFDDRFPPHMRLVVVRYDAHRHTDEIASYELLARQFLSEVDAAIARYAPSVAEVA